MVDLLVDPYVFSLRARGEDVPGMDRLRRRAGRIASGSRRAVSVSAPSTRLVTKLITRPPLARCAGQLPPRASRRTRPVQAASLGPPARPGGRGDLMERRWMSATPHGTSRPVRAYRVHTGGAAEAFEPLDDGRKRIDATSSETMPDTGLFAGKTPSADSARLRKRLPAFKAAAFDCSATPPSAC